ncbi:MAG: sensor domain-containing diguanylate cyclase [Burkholderiaceae bacterium]
MIRTLLVVVLLAVQVATVVIVMLGMRQQTHQQFSQNAQATLERLAENVAAGADRYLEPAERAVNTAHSLVAGGLIDPRQDEVLERYFVAQLRANEAIVGISLGRSDGSLLHVGRVDGQLRTKQVQVRDGRREVRMADPTITQAVRKWMIIDDDIDARTRPWYEGARRSAGPSWTGAYVFFTSKRPGITVSRAVQAPDGGDAGVLGIDIDIQAMSAFISRVPMAQHGTAAIIDERGYAVAYSDAGHLQRQLDSGSLPVIGQVAHKPLGVLLDRAGLAGGQPAPPGEGLRGGAGAYQTFMVDDVEYHGLAREFSMSGGRMNWVLAVEAPAADFSGDLATVFQQKLRTLVAAILIPAIIAILAVFGLTEPVYRLHEDATTDALTGCLNREEFRRRFDGMLRNRRESEYAGRLVLVALDLDGFKDINDRYGHDAGDEVLRAFAARLRLRIRQTDLLGRTGGDEFVLAMRLDRSVDVMATINRIRRSVVSRAFTTQAGRQLVGVTAGIACVEAGETPESAMARADQALITGKARTKNRCYLAASTQDRWPRTAFGRQASGPASDDRADTGPAKGPPARAAVPGERGTLPI